MSWRALKRKDGGVDQWAIGFVTYTVCKVVAGGEVKYEAWRLPGVMLGRYGKSADAQLACERDMQEPKPGRRISGAK